MRLHHRLKKKMQRLFLRGCKDKHSSSNKCSHIHTNLNTINHDRDGHHVTISQTTNTTTIINSTTTTTNYHHHHHHNNNNTLTLTHAKLLDVWLHVIGPKLTHLELVALSGVNHQAHTIAHTITSHLGFCEVKGVSSLRAGTYAMWTNLNFRLRLHGSQEAVLMSSNNNNTTTTTTTTTTTNNNNTAHDKSSTVITTTTTPSPPTTAAAANGTGCVVTSLWLRMWSFTNDFNLDLVSLALVQEFALCGLSQMLDQQSRMKFQTMVVACSSLVALELSSCIFRDEDAKCVAEAISQLPNISRLVLWDNCLNSDRMQDIAVAMCRTSHLTALQLSYNRLGAEAVQHVCHSFSKLPQLTLLDLSRNCIGVKGAHHLGNALDKISNLTHLDLYGGDIGSEGVGHLVPSFSRLPRLTHLFLGGNEAGNEMKDQVCQMLPNLKELSWEAIDLCVC